MTGNPGAMMGPPWMRGRGPGVGGPGMRGPGMMGSSMQRHRLAMMRGIPAAYQGSRNPLPANARVISEGRSLYRTHCAACHGEGGAGDGPAASGMWPPPADLRWVLRRPMTTDGYLMWAIGDGGTALGTGMPAFKDTLDEADRWRIIHFLRTL